MDSLVKLAVEVGRRRALFETTNKLRDELRNRLGRGGQVGWKERPHAPTGPAIGKPKALT